MTVSYANSLQGIRALVTGASSGVGFATAELLLSGGARVAAVARREDRLQALGAPHGLAALALVADVGEPDQAERAVDAALDAFGGLDVVVNSAAIVRPVALADLTPEVWQRTIATNLSGSFYIGRRAGLAMAAAGSGSIVNVASELASVALPMFVDYCSSKAGVLGLTRALAAELAPAVRVNAICPGPIDTPMLQAEFDCFPDPAAVRVEAVQRVPLGRFASAAEVADAIVFMATAAPFATGAAWELDGGVTVS